MLILHQYELSPFSAKARAMLGCAQLDWKSCLSSEMPPRDALMELTGGYRKIPVAQDGADIFCDTHCISEEIAVRSQRIHLSHAALKQDAIELSQHAESQVFFAALMLCPNWTLAQKAMRAMSWTGMAKFLLDRIQIGRHARVPPIHPRQAKTTVLAFLADLDNRLQQDFLFSDQPNAADFAAFVSLWIVHVLAQKPLLQAYPKVQRWMNRIDDFDSSVADEIDSEESLNIAGASAPRFIEPTHQSSEMQGREIVISPSDYARDGTRGTLIGDTGSSWILRRSTLRSGVLHVHFPKLGFEIKEV